MPCVFVEALWCSSDELSSEEAVGQTYTSDVTVGPNLPVNMTPPT